jgi:hypothetical protein
MSRKGPINEPSFPSLELVSSLFSFAVWSNKRPLLLVPVNVETKLLFSHVHESFGKKSFSLFVKKLAKRYEKNEKITISFTFRIVVAQKLSENARNVVQFSCFIKMGKSTLVSVTYSDGKGKSDIGNDLTCS